MEKIRKIRLHNTSTDRWEWFSVRYVRMPWERPWTRARWAMRYMRRFYGSALATPHGLDYDPQTMTFTDRRGERRARRRDRRDMMLAKVADVLNSMIEMQKFIK